MSCVWFNLVLSCPVSCVVSVPARRIFSMIFRSCNLKHVQWSNNECFETIRNQPPPAIPTMTLLLPMAGWVAHPPSTQTPLPPPKMPKSPTQNTHRSVVSLWLRLDSPVIPGEKGLRWGLSILIKVAEVRKAALWGMQGWFRTGCSLGVKIPLVTISIDVEAFLPLTDWRKNK